MNDQRTNEVRETVREHYGKVAEAQATGGGCCGSAPESSLALGYSRDDLSSVPEGANLGLGCGNPQAIAALKPGETVLDLGSGAGFDCFLAAKQVGPSGKVIGVDMTPEMIAKARKNAEKSAARNVELRLGEIEQLPVESDTIDVILSNCVINLSPQKDRVFREAFRVLKPGGRLAISDVVLVRPLPDDLASQDAALCGCVAGAAPVPELERMLQEAGFSSVRIRRMNESREVIADWIPGSGAEQYVVSASIEAVKPAESCCAPSCCGASA